MAISATISAGSYQAISARGTALDTTISSGAGQEVNFGGVASNTIVLNGGNEQIDFGDTAINTVISSGGADQVHGTTTGTIRNRRKARISRPVSGCVLGVPALTLRTRRRA
jgi:autotransporter passenger strand-loop-strand repeat protein